jgi:hypothetical protein
MGISLPSFWMHPGGGGLGLTNCIPKSCGQAIFYTIENYCSLSCVLKVTYLWTKVVSFVLFVTLSSPKPWPFMLRSWYLWKALSMNKGAWRFMLCSWYLWKALSMNRGAWHFMLRTWYLWKALSMSTGAATWFDTVWSYDVKAIEYFIICSMKTK